MVLLFIYNSEKHREGTCTEGREHLSIRDTEFCRACDYYFLEGGLEAFEWRQARPLGRHCTLLSSFSRSVPAAQHGVAFAAASLSPLLPC